MSGSDIWYFSFTSVFEVESERTMQDILSINHSKLVVFQFSMLMPKIFHEDIILLISSSVKQREHIRVKVINIIYR